jgi:hypothetical protein
MALGWKKSSAFTIPSGNQAAPRCIYALHPQGAQRVVTVISTITCGNKMDTVMNGLDQGVAVAVDLIQAVRSELLLFEHSAFDEPDQGAAVAANLILRLQALSLSLFLLMRTDWLQVSL